MKTSKMTSLLVAVAAFGLFASAGFAAEKTAKKSASDAPLLCTTEEDADACISLPDDAPTAAKNKLQKQNTTAPTAGATSDATTMLTPADLQRQSPSDLDQFLTETTSTDSSFSATRQPSNLAFEIMQAQQRLRDLDVLLSSNQAVREQQNSSGNVTAQGHK